MELKRWQSTVIMSFLKEVFQSILEVLSLNHLNMSAQARAKESPIKEFVFNLALRKKKEEIDRGIFRNDSVWDQLAFKKIHQLLGGRVKAIFCGSAPLDPNVMAFARAAMGAYVMEGEFL